MNRQIARPKLTVVTDPIPYGIKLFTENAKLVARYVRDRIKPPPGNYNRSKYRGHPAVTRSLIEGLISNNASFNYNPKTSGEFGEVVVVLSVVETLRQMILFKRKGMIKTLFAGPNIVIFSSDYDSILASPEIDYVITPCDWVIDMYVEDFPTLEGRCFAWPAGVDTEYWKPDPVLERKQILIFEKQDKGPVGPVQPYADYLERQGYKVVIMQYGTFNHLLYLQHLQQSCLMLGFATGESQGIAWAEAWSVDVPTLLWKNTNNVHRGRTYRSSTAPYLCDRNGLFFDDLDDFKSKFAYWQSNRDAFSPRAWTLENMSDKVCAATLCNRVTGVTAY